MQQQQKLYVSCTTLQNRADREVAITAPEHYGRVSGPAPGALDEAVLALAKELGPDLRRQFKRAEWEALRALFNGTSAGDVCRRVHRSPAWLKRLIAKLRRLLRQYLPDPEAVQVEAEVYFTFLEQQHVPLYFPPKHCPVGQEKCAHTGICAFRGARM